MYVVTMRNKIIRGCLSNLIALLIGPPKRYHKSYYNAHTEFNTRPHIIETLLSLPNIYQFKSYHLYNSTGSNP